MSRGRKGKLTPQLIEQVRQLIIKGVPVLQVCKKVGINACTYYDWKNRGHNVLVFNPANKTEMDLLCMQFNHAIQQAENIRFNNVVKMAQDYLNKVGGNNGGETEKVN